MEPGSQPNNGVWISREEYERLRGAQNQPGAVIMPAGSTTAPVQPMVPQVPAPTRRTRLVELTGVLIALLTYAGLAVDGWQWAAVVGLLGLLGLAVFSSRNLLRGRTGGRTVEMSGAAASAGHSATFKVVRALAIVGILVVCAPFLYSAAMIALLIVVCSFGGCRGS